MKNVKMAVRMIALLSLQHMLVDFMCSFGLYHDASIPFIGYVIYNFLAFVLQFPLGVLADHLTQKNRDKLLSSAMMVIAGTLLTIAGSWQAPVLAGLGNALFHVGGGILTIREDDRSSFKGRALGVFVAPGAIGLFMGMLLSKSSAYVAVKIAVSLVMLAVSLLIGITYSQNSSQYHPVERKEGRVLPVAICCFAVVALRSLVGLGIAFPWKTTTLLSVLSVICLASGKTLGGLIAVCAILIRKELLLPVLCGIFLAESASVLIQTSYFKYTKKKYGAGRRVFLMSPLHHHYQKKGFPEPKIVTRFWIVGIILAIVTLATLKIR